MRSEQKRRYYQRSQNNNCRKGKRWTPTEDTKITAAERQMDHKLSKSLGRSVQAIQQRRWLLSVAAPQSTASPVLHKKANGYQHG
jgi:hypothetical protein